MQIKKYLCILVSFPEKFSTENQIVKILPVSGPIPFVVLITSRRIEFRAIDGQTGWERTLPGLQQKYRVTTVEGIPI